MQIKKLNIIFTLLLPVQFLIITYLKSKSYFIENYYATTIYPIVSKILRFLLGWIPFSFGDVFACFLIGFILFNFYKLIKNKLKGFIAFTLKITSLISILYFCFYAFWGLNYFREPLAKKLQIKQAKYTTEQLIETGKKVSIRFNEEHIAITKNDTVLINSPLSDNEIFDLAFNAYKNIAKSYPELAYTPKSTKKSLVSLMHMYTGTNGYFNPITGEAQINDKIPRSGLPFTTCHEIAHQIGWSAENDANFVGFLTCINSDNKYFRYAGYRMAFKYILREIYKRDPNLKDILWKDLNKGIIKDFQNHRDHWNKYENPFEPYIKKGYNSYLKANNQALGIESYNYVVDLLLAYDNQKGIN